MNSKPTASRLRVLFPEYPSNSWSPGGKERQRREIATALSSLPGDTKVEPILSGISQTQGLESVDLVQLFGSEYYQYEMARRAADRQLPVVVFSILVYPSLKRQRLSLAAERIDRFIPTKTTLSLRAGVLREASRVLAATEFERRLIQKVYGVPSRRVEVVPFSVSSHFALNDVTWFEEATGISDFVLCVARFEARKNLLRLIEACRLAKKQLVLIGDYDHADRAYTALLRRRIAESEGVTNLGPLAGDSKLLRSAYAAASTTALVSLHETAGMTNLESAVSGTNVVTSDLPEIRSYLGSFAHYADPTSVESIASAIQSACASPFDPLFRQHVLNNFTHEAVARQLAGIYADVLEEKRHD